MAVETEDLAPPAFLSSAQQEAWRHCIANLTEAQARHLDVETLSTWIVAQDQHRTATVRQNGLDANNSLALLAKGKNGAASPSPYLPLIASAAEQMRRAAAALGFRPVARPMARAEAEKEAEATLDEEPRADAGEPVLHTGNKKEMARALCVSVLTLNRWLDRFGDAVPCIERGTNGRAYLFDIGAVVAFFRERREEELARQAERDEQLAQLALPLALPKEEDPGRLSLKDQADALRLRREQRIEAERLGLLVPAAELRDALTEAMASFNRHLHTRFNALASMRSLPADLTRAMHEAVNAAHADFAEELRQRVRLPDAA